jgi:hypothetical protein
MLDSAAPPPLPDHAQSLRAHQHPWKGRTSHYGLDGRFRELLGRDPLPGRSAEPGRPGRQSLCGKEPGTEPPLLGTGELDVVGELVDECGPKVRSCAGDPDGHETPVWIVGRAIREPPRCGDCHIRQAAPSSGECICESIPRGGRQRLEIGGYTFDEGDLRPRVEGCVVGSRHDQREGRRHRHERRRRAPRSHGGPYDSEPASSRIGLADEAP